MAVEKNISLKGGDYYITNSNTDAYRIKAGTILVYIVPVRNKVIGRRSFVYEAQENEVLPGFAYRDMDYCEWNLCFVALDSAALEIIENGSTKILKEKFAKKAHITNYQTEGFNEGLVDQYRRNIVTEDGFIRRSQQARISTSEDILQLIYGVFQKKKFINAVGQTDNRLYDSVAVICNKCHISISGIDKIKEGCGNDFELSDIARISHFAYREVILTDGWHKRDSGAFLVFDERKRPLACLPKGRESYVLFDPSDNSTVPVSKKVAASISAKAFMLYRPLPSAKISKKDIVSFCRGSVNVRDFVGLTVLAVITSLIGLLTPTISQQLYDKYIPMGAKTILFQFGCMMAAFMISNIMFSIVKNIVNFRLTSKMAYDTQGAIYDRLFNLPESFFRKYESADLAQRVMGAGGLVNTVAGAVISIAIALVFVVIYLVRMASYSGALTGIGIVMVLVYSAIYFLLSARALKYEQKKIELDGKTNSVMYQFLNGISKIRIAGVEDRALYEYMKPYIQLREHNAKKKNILGYSAILAASANSIFSIILYIVIIKGNRDISLGSFIAFNTVFGSFTAYFLQIVESLISVKNTKPARKRLQPLFDAKPELDDAKELPGDLSGGIEINNVTFAYAPDAPNVLNGLSLNIRPGEYVGLVGTSGCGKSTLLKLLLGFEVPTSGKIYYDNKDIESLDKRELRKKMGVVLQDGKLISGSIFENITITAPKAKLADVQKVVKAVGLENDINDMPMGLHTVLSEDCGTISGGQQQRILIARAIIGNPKIVFFDEATSALDNVTQSMVCETIEAMDSTRIVIAHRLSTIIKCDRIIVLDAGKVAEQGTYEELMANKGLFYTLASRQMA